MTKIDGKASLHSALDRGAFARGWKDDHVHEEVKAIVTESIVLDKVAGAERLKVPARGVFWFQKKDGNNWDRACCDPEELSKLPILVSLDMVTDHLPREYEKGMESVPIPFTHSDSMFESLL
eukprot:CAMPEP_0116549842 /NCGR_PEP_ID=MMETSP0397-20121206/5101_1 /TAXON_ID=216820 /ORGANISM="Cyclophora tenuis, Strain ECT3854" /LENGTH=121 /DNA_ID=CAMNT_0004074617 /DNA_START=823 /DNA_END=1188 /DNA_ORIENTATION=+